RPRRDHAGGRAVARRARAPGHGRAPVRARGGAWRSARRAREPRRLHRHARQRHRCRMVGGRAAERSIEEREPHRLLVELALASPARLAILPAQDLLGLGSEARMNSPGTAAGNWRFRLARGALDDDLAAWLAAATGAYGRSVANTA